MLKEFIIYSDLHIGAPNEIIENSDNYSTNSQNSLMDNSEKRILTNRIIHKCIFNLTKNTVLLGDNFEIKNSKKGKLKNLIALRENIRKKCYCDKRQRIFRHQRFCRQSAFCYICEE